MQIIDYFRAESPRRWLSRIRRADWSAAGLLAELLEQGRFFETLGQDSTLLLLANGDRLASFCTFARRDEVDDPALTPWAGFCYTFAEYRGRRCLGRLLDHACMLAAERGFDSLYLSTDHVGLYEKYGFSFLRADRSMRGGATRIYVRPVGGEAAR